MCARHTLLDMDERKALWAVAGPLIAFKVFATAILFIYEPSRDAIMIVVATSWPWAIALAMLFGAPTLAWYRLVKVRARREQLRRSEWMLDEQPKGRRSTNAGSEPQWRAWDPVSTGEPES